jgi:hypothetical protein
MGSGAASWICLAYDKFKWLFFVNTVMTMWVPEKVRGISDQLNDYQLLMK